MMFAREVMDHALANYEKGWDVVVETVELSELESLTAPATSLEEAIEIVRQEHVLPFAEAALNARWGEDTDPELQRWADVTGGY